MTSGDEPQPARAGAEDQQLKRMLSCWAATFLLYVVCTCLLLLAAHFGIADPAGVRALATYSFVGLLCFAVLVRIYRVLRIAPSCWS